MNPLQSARTELAELLEKKAEIERRIDAMQQTIILLDPVYGNDPPFLFSENMGIGQMLAAFGLDGDAGLTDRIRGALQAALPGSATPTAIRDLVVRSGFNAEGRSNFMAEIHNILRRLIAQGEAEEVPPQGGIKAYRAVLPSSMTTSELASKVIAKIIEDRKKK